MNSIKVQEDIKFISEMMHEQEESLILRQQECLVLMNIFDQEKTVKKSTTANTKDLDIEKLEKKKEYEKETEEIKDCLTKIHQLIKSMKSAETSQCVLDILKEYNKVIDDYCEKKVYGHNNKDEINNMPKEKQKEYLSIFVKKAYADQAHTRITNYNK